MRAIGRTRGFTLVELLTVIAIIAVLAAILLPVIGRARESARQTVCISNLHQIAVAMQSYWTDYRAYPPPPRLITDWNGDGTPEPPNTWEWVGGLSALAKDYLTTSALLVCPDDRDATTPANAVRAKYYCSYNGPPYVDDPATGYPLPDYTEEPSPGAWQLGGYNYYGYYNDGTPCSGKPCEVSPGVPGVPCNNPGGADHYILDFTQTHASPHLADADADGVPDKTDVPGPAKYPRLMNRYAPKTTIIAHCWHHRTFISNKAEDQLDILMNLAGSQRKAPWKSWASPHVPGQDPVDAYSFVYQPPL